MALLALEARGLFVTGKPLFKKLAGLLAVFIAVDAYLVGCELLTMGYPGAAESVALDVITTGAVAPFFWIEVLCGLLVPFLILVVPRNREKKGLVLLASALVVLGVLCKRIWILLTGFIAPFVEGTLTVPGQDLAAAGLTFGQVGAFYCPTVPELLIVVGVLALGVLGFMVLSNVLVSKLPAETSDACEAVAGK